MKKLLVLLLAAALCVSMLAACGSDDKPENSKTEQSQADNSGSTDDSTPSGNVEMQDFSILGCDAFTTYYSMQDSMEEFTAFQAFRQMMADAGLNLVMEYVLSDQYQTTLQTRFGSDTDIPYYVAAYDYPERDVMKLAAAGTLLDIKPLLEMSNGSAKDFFEKSVYGTMAANKVSYPTGEMYWVPNIYVSQLDDGTEGVGTNITVVIREDWLNEVGMEIPTTLDEYEAALAAFNAQDFAGTGANQPGFYVYSYRMDTLADGMAQWFGLVQGLVNVVWETDEAISPWHQDTITDYFNYVLKLNAQGLIDPEMYSSNSTLRTKASNNQVGSYTTYALATTYEPLIEGYFDASLNAMDGEKTALYADMMPIEAVPGVTPLLQIEDPYYMWDEFVFTNKIPDPQLAATFLDVYYSQESIDLINYGVEGINYELVNGEVQWLEYAAKEEQGSGEAVTFPANGENSYLQEKADQRLSIGKILYARTVTADMTFYQLEHATDMCYTQYWASQKADYQHATYDYGHWTSIDVAGTLATASDEESETFNAHYDNVNDASSEAISGLLTGTRTIDEIDSIVAQLDELGLGDLEAVYQARHNRFVGK